MHILLKTLEKSVISIAVLMFVTAAFAASPRDNTGAGNVNGNNGNRGSVSSDRAATTGSHRSGSVSVSSSRMPSMPVLPFSAVGNLTSSGAGNNAGTGGSNNGPVNPTPEDPDPNQPDPNPNPNPNPEPQPQPQPQPTNNLCDLSYTVDSCMADIAACINAGALPNGLNSMYTEEIRESIFNGMGLCISQVEYCISNVKLPKSDNSGCVNMYQSARDVWIDFNARRVQPSYYSFVLSRTGLTPTQAENTCLLLDRNTYGASFDGVGKTNNTTSEYAQAVSAYNQKPKKGLSKDNPQGLDVNTNGDYDANRGYYARWDAETAQCLLRVAAYNKDKLITNNVFGIGNNDPAQVWRAAGDTFTCNKDLFGFSLMTDTKKAAIVALPAGAAVGAGVGFLAGHKASDFDCNDEGQRRALTESLRTSKNISALRQFMKDHAISDVSDEIEAGKLASTGKIINKESCEQLRTLYEIVGDGTEALKNCESSAKNYGVVLDTNTQRFLAGLCKTTGIEIETEEIEECIKETNTCTGETHCTCKIKETIQKEHSFVIPIDALVVKNPDIREEVSSYCSFKEMNQAVKDANSVYCTPKGDKCITKAQFEVEIGKLRSALSGLEDVFAGQKDNRAKTAAIGAAVGTAAGGTATLITAFVEKSRINCRVGDDLERVELNKSYTIDRLRDFYVKWALQIPKTPSSSSALLVTNCGNWDAICGTKTTQDECENATVSYMPENVYTPREVTSACKMSGATCKINMTTANRYGIVNNDLTCPANTPSTGGQQPTPHHPDGVANTTYRGTDR